MASGRRQRRKKNRKALFAIEMVILAVLTVLLLGCIWVTQKFNLLNRKDLDSDRLFTSKEVNEGGEEEDSSSGLSGIELFALVGIDYREGNEAQNSDTLIIACVNHNEKTIQLVSVYRDTYLNINGPGEEYWFTKCNAAYNVGGPEQMLTMLNLNLDLNITQYVTVNFEAVARVVDELQGIDVDLTREEVVHLNNHLYETSEVLGIDYNPIDMPPQSEFDGAIVRSFHLDGAQAVAYSRIRQTTGDDFRRTARQRNVINKIFEKAKGARLGTLDAIMDAVFPMVETNISNTKILSLIQPLLSYTITTEEGFPTRYESGTELVVPVTGEDCVVPHTLEQNVIELHELLFPGEEYTPTATVQAYSEWLEEETGFTEYTMPDATDYGKLDPGITLEEARANGFDGESEDDEDDWEDTYWEDDESWEEPSDYSYRDYGYSYDDPDYSDYGEGDYAEEPSFDYEEPYSYRETDY